MKRPWMIGILAGLLAMPAVCPPAFAATNDAPDFKEIYELIRTNVAGVTEEDLNAAAVQGLLTAFSPKVSLAGVSNPAGTATAASPLGNTNRYEGDILYLRAVRVGDGLARAVNAACLASTNKLNGVVLDLRFTDGTDYAAAAAVADLFVVKAAPLLNWGQGMVFSHEKTNALPGPVVVLVNRETACAAEALAAMVRFEGVGLILGSQTAGQAMAMRDFPLKAGGRLRIATLPVTLGDGSPMPARGIKPDIEVAVSAEDERAYFADAFAALQHAGLSGGTNRSPARPTGTNSVVRRSHINEAELVKAHREGADRDFDPEGSAPRLAQSGAVAEVEKPVVNDPVLARALDLLRGLALVHPEHP